MKKFILILIAVTAVGFVGLSLLPEEENVVRDTDWQRHPANPVLRDYLTTENYQVASDGHIFFDESGTLHMIYSGAYEEYPGPVIKLARGNSWTDWEVVGPLLFDVGPSGKDIHKETSFYRRANDGKHQIYYIGYPEELNEDTGDGYEAEIYLAEADTLEGPYTQAAAPIVSKGMIAGKNVYTFTSPSVVEHESVLYLSVLGWDDSPERVTEVWVLGATSNDDGRTWSNFKEVETPIGMEGQVAKAPDGTFVAVRTDAYEDREAIFYATAPHPFEPWEAQTEPIIVKQGSGLEKHEVIAPQITFDPKTGEEYLYYTGADYNQGWWMMLAQPN